MTFLLLPNLAAFTENATILELVLWYFFPTIQPTFSWNFPSSSGWTSITISSLISVPSHFSLCKIYVVLGKRKMIQVVNYSTSLLSIGGDKVFDIRRAKYNFPGIPNSELHTGRILDKIMNLYSRSLLNLYNKLCKRSRIFLIIFRPPMFQDW